MIAIIEQPSKKKLEDMGIIKWPIWEKEQSKFDWSYDSTEVCYIIEGKAKIHAKNTDEFIEIDKGDLVTFPRGLHCTWEIIEDIRKHYSFE